MARLESQWTEIPGARIHARTGTPTPTPRQGPPIVLVHGLGVSSRYMAPTALALASELQVHAVDLPGFGLSSKPEGALDVPGLAGALVAWLKARALEEPVVVANSFGCQVAAELAATHPSLVNGLVLLAPTVDPEALSTARQLVRWLLTVPWERPSLAGVIARDYNGAGLARIRRTARFALADRIESKLARIEAPVLVVRGGRDRVVPQRWAERAAVAAPHGRLALIPGAAHCLNFSAPAEVAALVKDFVRERGTASGAASR